MMHPIDIVDKNNRLLGTTSNPEEANDKGLWHRGAHVIIMTPDGRVLVQRRSQNVMFQPQMLDIGVGGYVDSGETPEQTAVRELKEETGLEAQIDDLTFLGLSRYNHRWRYKNKAKINRAIIYTFVFKFQGDPHTIVPQKYEVEWAGFLPLKSALWLIQHGSIKKLGRLVRTYAYFRKYLHLAQQVIR